MKILFLTHRYTDTSIGGVAEFLRFLPPALRHVDVDSVLYTQAEDKDAKELIGPALLDTGLQRYSGPIQKPRFFPSKQELKPLLQLCREQQFDLVHAQGLYRAGYVAMQLHKKLGLPYIVTSHSDILEVNSERIKRRNIKNRCRNILKQATHVTHLTPVMAEMSHAIYNTREKSSVIHNGIDLTAWQAYANQSEKDYILAIGRIEAEKGFYVLLDAYIALQKQGLSTSLVIAGDGTIRQDLEAKALAAGLNVVNDVTDVNKLPERSVIFTGYLRGDVKKQFFAHAKMVLFATQPQLFEEAFGIVQLEAMAAGKAIIASDINATQYLTSLGMQAQLVQAESVTAWCAAMTELLKQPDQRKQLGVENLAAINQFDWLAIAKQYSRAYQLVCDLSNPATAKTD